MRVELCCVPADYGRGANDGVYYPVGLLTIGSYLNRMNPETDIFVIDLHHEPNYMPSADVVGISACSTLNYANALDLACRAKSTGATVVLGGQHASALAEQILKNRKGIVDFIIRGRGERAFLQLIKVLRDGGDLHSVDGLSWVNNGKIVRNGSSEHAWSYDEFAPLDIALLRSGISAYFDCFRTRIAADVDAAFPVFTHFGCRYRDALARARERGSGQKWCTYCSLNDPVTVRTGSEIVSEVLHLIDSSGVQPGAKVHLKCYGDNVGSQSRMLEELSEAIEGCKRWKEYDIGWTFYAQSSLVTRGVVDLLLRVGTRSLFVGFDTVSDELQRLNGLGSSLSTHLRTADLCAEAGIRIQAGFVLGCAGETEDSLARSFAFAERLAARGVLERINSAVMFVAPCSPAYYLLAQREPWLLQHDLLPNRDIQLLWLQHFCPDLGRTAEESYELVQEMANRLDDLSPGPHASMGFISRRLADNRRDMGGSKP